MSAALRIFQGSFGRVALLDMSTSLVVHAHSQCHILLKSGGADAMFRVQGRDCPLASNTAVLVSAWESHAYVHLGEERTVILALYIEPFWLSAIDGAFENCAHPQFFPQPCVSLTPSIKRLADRLAEEMLAERELDERTLESLMCEIIMHFSGLRSRPKIFRPERAYADFRIRRAILHQRENLTLWRKADELADVAGLSRPHFFAMFRRVMNLTPNVFFNVLRMDAAIAGLCNSDRSIANVATELGFSAQSHFTRFFRHHLGIAPSDYRRVVDIVQDKTIVPSQSAQHSTH
jgi:AraC-like DNA-binding protein